MAFNIRRLLQREPKKCRSEVSVITQSLNPIVFLLFITKHIIEYREKREQIQFPPCSFYIVINYKDKIIEIQSDYRNIILTNELCIFNMYRSTKGSNFSLAKFHKYLIFSVYKSFNFWQLNFELNVRILLWRMKLWN